ncbi:MAG: gas vesicle protein GvpG [Candidatus Nanopelagicales bacterium]
MNPLGILLSPITLGPRELFWVFEQVQDEADRELNDPVRLRGELMALQRRAAAGELSDAAYEVQEARILARLDAVEERQEAERADSLERQAASSTPRAVSRHGAHGRRRRR